MQNLIAATGHFRTGLVLAPVTADIVFDLIQSETSNYNLKKAAPCREYPK